MATQRQIIIIGGGAWGLSAALAIRARGMAVTVLDTGEIPHPLAASTDVSKAVRAGYGDDALYTDLMMDALARWRAWNTRWPRPLYHETGVAMLGNSTLGTSPLGAAPIGFEAQSYQALAARGAPVQWMDAAEIQASFPQWAPGRFDCGYVNAMGGWAEAGAVVGQLARDAMKAGVRVRTHVKVLGIEDHAVVTAEARLRADVIVVAAGSWTPTLLPELADRIWATVQSMFLLQPNTPGRWRAQRHPVFGADVTRTGWYGFPALPDGRLKIAHHGKGRRQAPDAARRVPLELKARLRSFLSDALPALADAPIANTHSCAYSDMFDGHFLIDRHPDRPGVIVASGGSGHGFKFTPLIGEWVASLLDGGDPIPRFAWRPAGALAQDAARADR
ncbi:MAG: glycine/D-amino acid oxidase-like deaminating enzyme [Bradymonadia bacterium]